MTHSFGAVGCALHFLSAYSYHISQTEVHTENQLRGSGLKSVGKRNENLVIEK